MENPRFSVVLITDELGSMSYHGMIPWPIGDFHETRLKSFFQTVLIEDHRNAVILGRETYQRLWKRSPSSHDLLPGMLKLVLTRNPRLCYEKHPDVFVVHSLHEAMDFLSHRTGSRDQGVRHDYFYPHEIESIYVLGGTALCEEAIQSSYCRRVFMTLLHPPAQVAADKIISWDIIQANLKVRSVYGEGEVHGYNYQYLDLAKKKTPRNRGEEIELVCL